METSQEEAGGGSGPQCYHTHASALVTLAWSLSPGGILSGKLDLCGLDWTHLQAETTAGTTREKGTCRSPWDVHGGGGPV